MTNCTGHIVTPFALAGVSMPWMECSVMDERLRFVARLLEGEAHDLTVFGALPTGGRMTVRGDGGAVSQSSPLRCWTRSRLSIAAISAWQQETRILR